MRNEILCVHVHPRKSFMPFLLLHLSHNIMCVGTDLCECICVIMTIMPTGGRHNQTANFQRIFHNKTTFTVVLVFRPVSREQ